MMLFLGNGLSAHNSLFIYLFIYVFYIFFVFYFIFMAEPYICLLILIEFTGRHCLIKIYRFQVYNSIIHDLYIVLCVHHPKSPSIPNYPPTPSSISPQLPYPVLITLPSFLPSFLPCCSRNYNMYSLFLIIYSELTLSCFI